ncbi:MAG: DUF3325 family protein [Pseudomonadota bacterium]
MALALTLSYSAVVAFYHAAPKRAAASLQARLGSDRLGRLRWLGWALLSLALVLCVVATDVARGISIWLGLLGVCAAGSLVCAVMRPSWHFPSVGVVAGIGLLGIAMTAAFGA